MATLDIGSSSPTSSGATSGGEALTPEQESLLARDFVIVNRQSANGETLRSKIGTAADWNTHSGFINRPTSIRHIDGDDFFVTNYYDKPAIMTRSESGLWSMNLELPVPYQSPSAANTGIAYTRGGDIDLANDRVVLSTWGRHCVRQYDLAGNLQFTIGTPGLYGNHADNRLYYAAQAMYLPSGELAVISYYGFGDGCNNHGHISVYDPTDGSFIATRAGCTAAVGTVPETGGIYRPIDAVADGNLLYVLIYGRSRVAVLDMSQTNADGLWPVVDVILMPGGAMFAGNNSTTAELWGIDLTSDGNLIINSRRNNEIYCIDPRTKQHVWTLDLIEAGYQGDNYRIAEVAPGYIMTTSWGTSRLQVVAAPGLSVEQYDVPIIPADWEVYEAPSGFDVATGVLTLSGPRDTAPEKITLALRKTP